MAHRAACLRSNSLIVQSYPAGRRGVMRAFTTSLSVMRAGVRIFRWAPERILCGSSRWFLWMSVAVAKLRRVPIVCARHTGLRERKGLGAMTFWLDRSCIRACDAVVCHGPFLKAQVVGMGIAPEKIFEFDVDLTDFATRKAHPSIPEPLQDFTSRKPALVMFVGRIQQEKGILDLLEAFDGLVASIGDPVGLVYVGHGPDMARLQTAVLDRGLSESVLLLGKVPHDQLSKIMRCATVLATPTRPALVEGRCMVMLESLMVGVPVVAPAFAAFPYAIEDGVNGLLFTVGSTESLQDCLTRIFKDPARLERLRRGAVASSKQLLRTGRGFAAAVEAAFG